LDEEAAAESIMRSECIRAELEENITKLDGEIHDLTVAQAKLEKELAASKKREGNALDAQNVAEKEKEENLKEKEEVRDIVSEMKELSQKDAEEYAKLMGMFEAISKEKVDLEETLSTMRIEVTQLNGTQEEMLKEIEAEHQQTS